MGHFKDIFKSSLASFATRSASAAFSLLSTILWARMLSFSDFGYFTFVIIIIKITSAFTRLGIENNLMKLASTYDASEKKGKLPTYFYSSQFCILILSVTTTTVLISANNAFDILPFPKQSLTSLLAIALCIVTTSLSVAVVYFLRGIKKAALSNFFENGIDRILLLFVGIFYFFMFYKPDAPPSGNTALYLFTLCSVANLAAAYASTAKAVSPRPPACDIMAASIPLAKTSLKFLTVSLIANILPLIDTFLLGVISGGDAVAKFNPALQVAGIMTMLLASFNSIIAPKFARIYASEDKGRLKSVGKGGTIIIVLLAAPFALACLVYAEEILGIWGPAFANSAPILRILILGQMANTLTGSIGFLLLMTGHESAVSKNFAMTLIFNIILNSILIRLYGVYGAALANAATVVYQYGMLSLYAYKNIGYTLLPISTANLNTIFSRKFED